MTSYLFHIHVVPATVTPLVTSPIVGIHGMMVTLIFSISNDDPLVQTENIRWERLTSLNVPLDITESDDPHYQLANDRLSLTIVQLTDGQVGIYTLYATNEAGTRSNFVALVLQGMKHEYHIQKVIILRTELITGTKQV